MRRFISYALAALVLLTACDTPRDEESSATTEDGRYDAKLYYEYRGATNPGTTALFLTKSGATSKFKDRLLWGSGDLSTAKMEWKDHILLITYSSGEIYEFSNRWNPPGSPDKIEVRLYSQCEGMCVKYLRRPALKAPPADMRDQVLAITSPNGELTALLTKETSSSTHEPLYRLRIITDAETHEEKWSTMVLEAKDLKDPAVAWDGPRPVLLFSYAGGEITKFQNIWKDAVRAREGHGEYNIEIRLVPWCESMCF